MSLDREWDHRPSALLAESIVLRMLRTLRGSRARETTMGNLQPRVAQMRRCRRSHDRDIDQQALIATDEQQITTLRIVEDLLPIKLEAGHRIDRGGCCHHRVEQRLTHDRVATLACEASNLTGDTVMTRGARCARWCPT